MKVAQSFLHYFHAAIINNLSEKPKICLVLYDRLTQVGLYHNVYAGNNKGADQIALMCRLICNFDIQICIKQVLS